MTRTINQIYETVRALKLARKSMSDVILTHLDDGQSEILSDAMHRISTSITELTEVENELRHGKVWSEPLTDEEKVQDVIDWVRNR
jgi:hypothetical protein